MTRLDTLSRSRTLAAALFVFATALVHAPVSAHAQARLVAPRLADHSHQMPRAHTSHTGRDYALVGSGIGLLLGGWVANMVAGSLAGWHAGDSCALSFSESCTPTPSFFDPAWSDFRTASPLPLAGPIMQAVMRPAGNDLWPVWLTIDEILQLGGLALLVAGAALLPGDSSDAPSITVMPMVTPSSMGLVVGGRF